MRDTILGGSPDPTTVVFAAGNTGCENPGAKPGPDCDQPATDCTEPFSGNLQNPAVAKNIITVGAVENDYPGGEASCFTSNPFQNIWEVWKKSARGALFGPKFSGEPTLEATRVKPDLVAPGARVHSTVPMETWTVDSTPQPGQLPVPYGCLNRAGCVRHEPLNEQLTYAVGTSFAAPAVAGAAALFTKRMQDGFSVAPSPSLVKAAMVATADELIDFDSPGDACWQGNCRPSNHGGWGRLNLDRLTDPNVDILYVNEPGPGLATGDEFVVATDATYDDLTKDVLIVLAWSDWPDSSLVNDLDLYVHAEYAGLQQIIKLDYWGNNFRENVIGIDDGYSYPYDVTAVTCFGSCGSPTPPLADGTNNVEAVFIRASDLFNNETFDIKVFGQSVTEDQDDPTPRQLFSVYAYNLGTGP